MWSGVLLLELLSTNSPGAQVIYLPMLQLNLKIIYMFSQVNQINFLFV